MGRRSWCQQRAEPKRRQLRARGTGLGKQEGVQWGGGDGERGEHGAAGGGAGPPWTVPWCRSPGRGRSVRPVFGAVPRAAGASSPGSPVVSPGQPPEQCRARRCWGQAPHRPRSSFLLHVWGGGGRCPSPRGSCVWALRDLVVQLARILLKPLAGLLAERIAWAAEDKSCQLQCCPASAPTLPQPPLAPQPLSPTPARAPSLPPAPAAPSRSPPGHPQPHRALASARAVSLGRYRCDSCAPRYGARRTCSCTSWRCW